MISKCINHENITNSPTTTHCKASLNMILRQSQSSTQQTTEDEDEETNNEEEDEDQYKKRLGRNFSLEWLKTAMPMNTQSMAATQAATSRHNSEQTAYEYACPRCELQHNDLRPLSYIYRFWLVLRDATSQLDPCLLEADAAYRILDRVEPLKFFASAAKSHAVYKTIHSALNRKYLFTIETFRLPDNIHGNNSKKLDVLFKIADMTEIVSN